MNSFKDWLQMNETANWGHGRYQGAGGWKIHLRTGPDDKNRDRAYEKVLAMIKGLGKNWPSKKLDGGEADSKDITIYCGSRQEANQAAQAISDYDELKKLLKPPSNEVLADDIELVPMTGVYGRFNADIMSDEFHQYGCKGHSMRKEDINRLTYARRDPNFSLEDFKKKACADAYSRLKTLYGKDFTG